MFSVFGFAGLAIIVIVILQVLKARITRKSKQKYMCALVLSKIISKRVLLEPTLVRIYVCSKPLLLLVCLAC